MDVFVKKDAVDDIKALVDFRKFETKKTDILPTLNIDVGSAAYKSLKIASKRDSISADQVHGFRNDCKRIVKKILDKIHEYITSSASRICSFSCLDPALIAVNPPLALRRFTSMLNHFVSTGLVTSAVADASNQEFRTMITLNNQSLFRLDDKRKRKVG